MNNLHGSAGPERTVREIEKHIHGDEANPDAPYILKSLETVTETEVSLEDRLTLLSTGIQNYLQCLKKQKKLLSADKPREEFEET